MKIVEDMCLQFILRHLRSTSGLRPSVEALSGLVWNKFLGHVISSMPRPFCGVVQNRRLKKSPAAFWLHSQTLEHVTNFYFNSIAVPGKGRCRSLGCLPVRVFHVFIKDNTTFWRKWKGKLPLQLARWISGPWILKATWREFLKVSWTVLVCVCIIVLSRMSSFSVKWLSSTTLIKAIHNISCRHFPCWNIIYKLAIIYQCCRLIWQICHCRNDIDWQVQRLTGCFFFPFLLIVHTWTDMHPCKEVRLVPEKTHRPYRKPPLINPATFFIGIMWSCHKLT